MPHGSFRGVASINFAIYGKPEAYRKESGTAAVESVLESINQQNVISNDDTEKNHYC